MKDDHLTLALTDAKNQSIRSRDKTVGEEGIKTRRHAHTRKHPTILRPCLLHINRITKNYQKLSIHSVMKPLTHLAALGLGFLQAVPAHGDNEIDGIRGLANRLFKGHGDAFDIVLTQEQQTWSRWNSPTNDNYTVSRAANGKILLEGTTLSALSRG